MKTRMMQTLLQTCSVYPREGERSTRVGNIAVDIAIFNPSNLQSESLVTVIFRYSEGDIPNRFLNAAEK